MTVNPAPGFNQFSGMPDRLTVFDDRLVCADRLAGKFMSGRDVVQRRDPVDGFAGRQGSSATITLSID